MIFIRNNMLEQRDTEEEYNRLNDSFARLIEARTTIEKVSEQIVQLKPIDEKARQLENFAKALSELQTTREMAVYWFAQKNMELANAKLVELNEKLSKLNEELTKLNADKEDLKGRERALSLAIENDNVGQQIKTLEKEMQGLERTKQSRQKKLDEYNKKVREVGFSENPAEVLF